MPHVLHQPRPAPRALATGLALLLAGAPLHAAELLYRGTLEHDGAPADGRYDLRVRAYAAEDTRLPALAAIDVPDVTVADGHFAVTLDVPGAGQDTWLELAVRPAGSGAFVPLHGRTRATPAMKTIGQCWSSTGDAGSNASTNFLGTLDAQPLVLRTRNAQSLRLEPSTVLLSGVPVTANVIAGGQTNIAAAGVRGATIAGGGATPGGDPSFTTEARNEVLGHYGSIGGGFANVAGLPLGQPEFATLATVGGGELNTASGTWSTVSGGERNTASGLWGAVPGGAENTAAGDRSAVGGGFRNCAGGHDSWAGGSRAKVRRGTGAGGAGAGCAGVPLSTSSRGDEGTFAWADSQSADFVSTGPDQFNIRARGGVGINTPPRDVNVEMTIRGRQGDAFGGNADVELIIDNANQEGIQFGASNGGAGVNDANFEIAHKNATTFAPRLTLFGSGAVTIRSNNTGGNTGVTMAAGSGAWSSLSDRHQKTAFVAVDPLDVLARVLALPMATWSYRAQGAGIRHMGPMAQDFHAAFGLGESDTRIATIDADGVALAAIQGLHQKLEAERAALRAENAALKARLDRIERLLGTTE